MGHPLDFPSSFLHSIVSHLSLKASFYSLKGLAWTEKWMYHIGQTPLCEPILVLSWVSPTTLGQKEALAGLVIRALA